MRRNASTVVVLPGPVARGHAAGRPGGSWPARVYGRCWWWWFYQMVMSEALRAVYQAV